MQGAMSGSSFAEGLRRTRVPAQPPLAAAHDERMLNAMTVDVEDYFQVSAFEGVVPRSDWASLESRVCRNTGRLLDMFEAAGIRATFLVLGWVAERYPALVRQIASAGHELASHSFHHQLVYSLTPEEFREDLRRARTAIENAAGVRVLGYRAPSYSVTRESLWALDVLIEEGYTYDSSIYPIRHDRYGIPDWDRGVHRIQRPAGALWELPGSTVRMGGTNLPIGGGGYFRLLPYGWTSRGIRRLNEAERQPAIFYLHPWEIDPAQPRIPAGRLSRFRHYRNLAKTEDRLARLLRQFRFGTVSEVLAGAESARAGQTLEISPVLTGVLSANR
jgi:polysaccharide deacetylase family protein (PEP-CTERM system associated)